MGRKVNDMTGYKHEKIKVTGKDGKNKSGNILWKYECSCGGGGVATADALKRIKSCGCERKKRGKEFFHKYNKTHGESRTRLYHIWGNMINRTTNKNNNDYKNYGGRGIAVCEEWKDFLTFKEWALGNGYSEELTLDREDNDKGYYPSNCRWADWDTQNNNKQQSTKYKYKGKIQTVDKWAKEFDINRGTLVGRLKRGLTIAEAIETPIKGGKRVGYKPHKKEK